MRTRPVWKLLAAGIGLALAGGCSGAGEVPDPPGEVLRSELEREMAPDVSPANQAALVDGNTAFALDLFALHEDDDGNLFYSPHSISTALAMAYAGAAGDTATQMAAALHYDLAPTQLHEAFNWLDLELDSRGEGADGADGGEFRLRVLNATFAERTHPFLESFLDVLAVNYGAGLHMMDFIGEPESCRIDINDWVSVATEERIPELLPEGVINSLTRLVLVNAVYFNAAWKTPFEEADTADGVFTLLDGSQVTVPLMNGNLDSVGYFDGAGYQVVELPYEADDLSMVIVLPDAGLHEDFEDNLDVAVWNDLVDNIAPANVALTLPKWEFRWKVGMRADFEALGMTDAFEPGVADLSGMDGMYDLHISAIIHEAFVNVNEAGTEAAAATAVIVGTTSVPTYIPVSVNRPFLFFIRDIPTGAVLFVGRVMNPAE